MGGRSTRMGSDKAFLVWDGKPIYLHAAQKLTLFCDEVFLSVNYAQKESHTFDHKVITDLSEGNGPLAGILSCHKSLRDTLLILGCDMPFLSYEDIVLLSQSHKQEHGCTLYYNTNRNCYEPMLSIWDINMLDTLDTYFQNGGRSIQRFLIDHDVQKIMLPDERNFRNLNTVIDWQNI